MTMTTKNNENRTGIYVQESAGVTTAGDGLGPRGHKSPVTQNYDKTLNRSQLGDEQNQEKNPIHRINPFNRSTSQLSSIDGGAESESDTNDDSKPGRNHKFRIERSQLMKNEFLKLGFLNQEIRTMQLALEEERKLRHNQNKVIRFCEEKQMNPESVRQIWLERKERELAKFRAEKAAKIAAGTFDPIPFRERKRKGDRDSISSHGSSSGNLSKQFHPSKSRDESNKQYTDIQLENLINYGSKMIFVSPAILAGVREEDGACSIESKRIAAQLRKQMEFGRGNDFEEVRARMDLRGPHISRRYSSDSLPETQDPESQSLNTLEERYPFEVQILNRAHPFGEIPEEIQFLMLDALETTIQDERNSGAQWIKISPGRYVYRRLHVNCRNMDTVRCLESKIPLYNRLWRGADLFLTKEIILYKKSKYKVNIPNFHLTSDEFFKIIKKQNGFPTEYWTLYYRARDNTRFKAFFSVDPETDRFLEESNGFVYFFFDKIQFCLHEKINKNEMSQ